MRHYILASHGTFAEGIYQSIRIILGEQSNVHRICAYGKEDIDLALQLQAVIEAIPVSDEIIACTDMFGGSVNNAMMRLMTRANVHVIAGMNLPLLLHIFLAKDKDAKSMLKHVIAEASNAIVYCNTWMEEEVQEEHF